METVLTHPAPVVENIDRAMVEAYRAEVPRGHLGMSQIGKQDSRELWFKFRWSLPDEPAPRVLRIFDLGNVIEDEVIKLLRQAGYTLLDRDSNGAQFNATALGGHFSGSCDGIVTVFPDGDNVPHVFECKSANAKRFKKFQQDGVRVTSPEYYGQMQCYMNRFHCKRALFVMYCKDNSELYTEFVDLDPNYYPEIESKALRIIVSDTPPPSSYPNRAWYEAKYMSEEAQAVYWGEELPTRTNCRNCRHSCPIIEGEGARWGCHRNHEYLGRVRQWNGCNFHNWIPDLVPAELVAIHDKADAVEYRTKGGARFFNGPKTVNHADVFSSDEIGAASRSGFGFMEDEFVRSVRGEFGGRLVEGSEVFGEPG